MSQIFHGTYLYYKLFIVSLNFTSSPASCTLSGKEHIIQNDQSTEPGWVGIGDYETGEVSIGQACEGPSKSG